MKSVLYVHGKGGSAAESAHYRPLFPDCEAVGLDYRSCTPWETGPEIRAAVEALREKSEDVLLIANSIGAFFSLHAGLGALVEAAWFISPIVDMEKLIVDMMGWAGVSEAELEARRVVPTDFGEDLSWEYLRYVRSHPVDWSVPTRILYGSRDHLTSYETVRAFAEAHGASLTVMEGGEHWFHTAEQMRFLDDWIRSGGPWLPFERGAGKSRLCASDLTEGSNQNPPEAPCSVSLMDQNPIPPPRCARHLPFGKGGRPSSLQNAVPSACPTRRDAEASGDASLRGKPKDI